MQALNIFRHNLNKYYKGLYMEDVGELLYTYKNIEVYQRFDRHYDLVVDGVIISQRCGWSKEQLERIHSGNDMYTNIDFRLKQASNIYRSNR